MDPALESRKARVLSPLRDWGPDGGAAAVRRPLSAPQGNLMHPSFATFRPTIRLPRSLPRRARLDKRTEGSERARRHACRCKVGHGHGTRGTYRRQIQTMVPDEVRSPRMRSSRGSSRAMGILINELWHRFAASRTSGQRATCRRPCSCAAPPTFSFRPLSRKSAEVRSRKR